MSANASLINRFIGRRIRERRVLLGLNQSQLAEPLGLVVTQIVRYERGENGVSAGLLFEIARALDTSPDYFFEGLEDAASAKVSQRQRVLLNLVRCLGEIESREQLAVIRMLTRALMTKQQRPRYGKPAAARRRSRVKKESPPRCDGQFHKD